MGKAGGSTSAQMAESLRRPASDPATRIDGRCIECGKTRPAVAVAHDDPFCSARCARVRYGVPIAGDAADV